MTRPAILTVDDDEQVSAAIGRDLRRRYGRDYRIVRASSGAEALEVLAELALRDRPVALVAVDQRMPHLTGIETLAAAQERGLADGAKRLLLTAYADTSVAIQAINDIGLDHYLFKPWDPPEENLYPVIDDLLGDWHAENPDQTSDVRVVDHRWSDRGYEVKTFLARNHVPYRWFDVELDDEGKRLAELAGVTADDLPLVLPSDGDPLRSPTTVELAGALGLSTQAQQPLYDVCIVGGGPAGLASAVYAASEGLSTIVVERQAPGGQAGTSAAIENYLGFPKGLSGADLTHRAMAQVQRFGAEMVLARDVVALEQRGPVRAVVLDGDPDDRPAIEARSVIVSTGVSYRRLEAQGIDDLTGRGVYYGADASDARQVVEDDVYVVGAANSAGQAALNMAKHARRVVMLVRAGGLEASMSRYLIDRIDASPDIEVRTSSEVTAARGEGHLESLTILDRTDGSCEDVAASWLFVFIGAQPRTDWLGKDVARDERGYVVTGPDLARFTTRACRTGALAAEPGAVRVGDERSGSVRGGRRAPRLHEAGRVCGRRGRDGCPPGAPLPRHHLRRPTMRVDDLRPLPIFAGVSDERLAELLAVARTMEIEPGTELFHEGEPADHWWVLVDGAVDLFRTVGGEETRVGRMDAPGRWAGGFRAWDESGVYLASGRGVEFGRLLRVPADDLRGLMERWLPLSVHLIRGVFGTARSIESTVRQRESLVTLGTLAAGLAHELNNPAAAAVRTVDAMSEACDSLLSSLGGLARGAISAEQFLHLDELRLEVTGRPPARRGMALSDAEDELVDWLDDHGMPEAYELASALAAASVEAEWCDRAADLLDGPALRPGLEWIAGTLAMGTLLGELREATGRVSELVGAVRSYTQMDRATIQPVDVVEGLESTLVMLHHKTGAGVEVVREYADDLPRVEAHAGELNQVWTNLIDNAVDAMEGTGRLRVTVRAEDDAIVIEIADTGAGLTDEVAARAFDAFYTTKDVGKGTGLGLDIARRVIVERHSGTIDLVREGGETVARIRLPR